VDSLSGLGALALNLAGGFLDSAVAKAAGFLNLLVEVGPASFLSGFELGLKAASRGEGLGRVRNLLGRESAGLATSPGEEATAAVRRRGKAGVDLLAARTLGVRTLI
jgi:hypothetical protein